MALQCSLAKWAAVHWEVARVTIYDWAGNTALYYTALCYTALYYTALYYTAL